MKFAAQAERYLAEQGKVLSNIDEASDISPKSLLRILDRRFKTSKEPRGY